MGTKEVKIEAPEGYEIDKDNNTFEKIVFKKRDISYVDCINDCTYKLEATLTDAYKTIEKTTSLPMYSEKQSDKIIAMNKLMNVAKYLNGDWKPNDLGYIFKIAKNRISWIEADSGFMDVKFKDEQTIKMAFDIIGKDVIKQALSNDY